MRYWWAGEGPRGGVAPWVQRKLHPGDDPVFGHAARHEVLLPPCASGDYANLDFLVDRFDRTLPPFERHALIQVKLALDPNEPWHVGYERARSYAHSHFVAMGHPVVLVAHIPATAGLAGNGNHVHCIVLSRFLGINGFGGADHLLCSDRGHLDAYAAWQAHIAATAA